MKLVHGETELRKERRHLAGGHRPDTDGTGMLLEQRGIDAAKIDRHVTDMGEDLADTGIPVGHRACDKNCIKRSNARQILFEHFDVSAVTLEPSRDMIEESWFGDECSRKSSSAELIHLLKTWIDIISKSVEKIEEVDLHALLVEEPCKFKKTVRLEPEVMAGKIMDRRMDKKHFHDREILS